MESDVSEYAVPNHFEFVLFRDLEIHVVGIDFLMIHNEHFGLFNEDKLL